jgi:phage terminase small subunit
MSGKSTGRSTKPTAIKKAQGTLRKDRVSENEPTYAIVKAIPDAPEYFTERARNIYLTTGLDLINQGLLTTVSLPQFISYCYYTAASMDLMKMINEQGYFQNFKGQRVQNQNVKTLTAYSALSRQFASEFGLTPATSGKITVPGKKKSKLDDFI